MATCRDVIARALRKINALASLETLPDDQAVDCLTSLQGLYLEWVSSGAFGRLNDIIVTDTTYTAREQDRVVCNNAAGVTVTLPGSVTDDYCGSAGLAGNWPLIIFWNGAWDYGASFSSNPRPPLDLCCIQVTDQLSDFSQTFIYEASFANWTLIEGLTLNSKAPLSTRSFEGLAAALGEWMADDFGAQMTPNLARAASNFRYALTHKYERGRRNVQVPYL